MVSLLICLTHPEQLENMIKKKENRKSFLQMVRNYIKPVIMGIFMAVLSFITACNGSQQKSDGKTISLAEQIMKAEAPVFNPDSAYYFIEKQVEFGPRVPNTTAHSQCAWYLMQSLGNYTTHLDVQEAKVRAYDGTVLNIKNIIGSFNTKTKDRILLCAHWDTRPFADHDPDPANHFTPIPGANDGASGVGVLLEIARQISLNPINIGIDIILFDAEDYGEHQSLQARTGDYWALGAQYWAKNPHINNYNARFGILLDMVGASDAVFTMEATSMYYAPDIMKKVWDISHQIRFGSYFSYKRTNAVVDDHTYINEIANIPTIDIIHYGENSYTGFFEHWHTVNDNMDVIDKNTLNAVGQTVLTFIYLENMKLDKAQSDS
jgi:hypothetical protein